MDDRFRQLPRSLAERTTRETLASEVPALIAQPEGDDPVPFVLWMHGRTANKELDPGRYLRWVRAGIAAVAVDLPGHGERAIPDGDSAENGPAVIAQMAQEIDPILQDLRARFKRLDFDRCGIGGMSAGGMATFRRLCDPHPFACAAVEGTTGDLQTLYFPPDGHDRSWPVSHDRDSVERVDAARRLESFRPIPLLALHNEGDELVPLDVQKAFLSRLQSHYRDQGADPDLIRLHTFKDTGAPQEHAGFGRHGTEAKNLQVEFLKSVLRPDQP